MEEGLQGGGGFCMAENLQKKGWWEPFTPAKPIPARPESESISIDVGKEQSLKNFDAAINSRERVEDGLNSTVTGELDDHEKTRPGGVNGSFFDKETSRIGEHSRNQYSVAEMGERLDIGRMQQLLWGNACSRNQSNNGFDSTMNPASHGRDGGITDNGGYSSLDCGQGNGFGTNKPQNLKKRKRKNMATDLKRRPKLPVKKHRPKIFDETKPKKIPRSQNKPKSEKKRKDNKKPKVEKKRKEVKRHSMLKSANASLANSCITDPQTPEPSTPNRISSSTGSSRCVSSSEEHNGKAFDSCSEHITISCKRTLVYDLDVGQGASPSQDSSDKIGVSQYRVYTRRRKSFREMDFNLNLEVQDFESCVELRKIVWEVKTLKSQPEDFPVTSKRMRMRRRKATAYPYFLEASKQQMLPTLKQFAAAIVDPKSFRCVLALQPKVISRKKRSNRLKKIAAATRRLGFSSYNYLCFSWALESVCEKYRLRREMHSNCALPPSDCPRRKRSHRYKKKHALAISSSDFGSNPNEIEIKKSPLSIDLNAFPRDFEEPLGFDNGGSVTAVVESSEVKPQNSQIWECLPYEDSSHGMQLHMSQYQGVLEHKMKQQTSENKDLTTSAESHHLEVKGLVDDLIKKLETLSISNVCKQILVYDQSSRGALVPSKRRTKREKPPEVIPDEDTMRVWMLLMEEEGSENTEEKYWEEQRKIFCGRVDVFIKCMHLIQGDRRFSRWKGSVVDSVVGVFLTQNVSDHLSSNAFMTLAAKFPKHPIKSENDTHDADESIKFSQESFGSNIEIDGLETVEEIQQSCAYQIQQNTNDQFIEEEENAILTTGDVTGFKGATLNSDALSKYEVSSGCSLKEEEVANTKTKHGSNNNMKDVKKNGKKGIMSDSGKSYRGEKGEPEKKQESSINWDDLRKEFATISRDTTGDTNDSVDWEAVRCARVEEIAAAIKKRGMNNVLAAKIKDFLNRMARDHGSIDLEWLRNIPPEKTKEFLLSIQGIGLKSVECVRLLTLHQHAFPVDTNVGRIVVRLGWVPLQPLPDGVQLHLLEQYPVMNAIQKYLWPRLSALDQQTLYELHYQMITFGKVFCTKVKPKCSVCPVRESCKHFASAFASSQLSLPGPQEKGIVNTKADCTANQDPTRHEAPLKVSFLDDNFLQSRHESQICEPVVEMPASPKPINWLAPEMDIEDLCSNVIPEEEIDELSWDLRNGTTLRFNGNAEDLRARESAISLPMEYTVSKALVLAPEADSFPAPKLKSFGRLHTEHEVYELPDDHCLLAGFRKREPDDPSPYLFAIWITDDTTNIIEENNDQTVSGTILMPCRTANGGRFPLGGTYFQVNEVFADHETSENPIRVSRGLLWSLRKRRVYCAVSGRSIFTDMSLLEIHHCFWNGFICERGFDRKTREPQDLHPRFHIPKSRSGKSKDNNGSEIKRTRKPGDDNGSKMKSRSTRKGMQR